MKEILLESGILDNFILSANRTVELDNTTIVEAKHYFV